MARECKKYRMRSSRKPARNALLSSVVKVTDETGKHGYCYVGFDSPLVDLVGRKLSRGVAPYDPAYLIVEYANGVWTVTARYLTTDEGVVLWETAVKPDWLKQVYFGGTHGGNAKNKNTGTSSRGQAGHVGSSDALRADSSGCNT